MNKYGILEDILSTFIAGSLYESDYGQLTCTTVLSQVLIMLFILYVIIYNYGPQWTKFSSSLQMLENSKANMTSGTKLKAQN